MMLLKWEKIDQLGNLIKTFHMIMTGKIVSWLCNWIVAFVPTKLNENTNKFIEPPNYMQSLLYQLV
jgi:hypothetical protein